MHLVKNTVIVDANVILRYLLRDSEDLYEKSKRLFEEAVAGKVSLYVMHSVIAEVIYVLIRVYEVPRTELVGVLYNLFNIRGVKLRDKEIVLRALNIFRSSKLDFVDALLCAYGRELPIISFYKALNKCVEDIRGDSP